MTQRTFFDDELEDDLRAKRLARSSDPSTSKQAASETAKRLNRLQQQAMELIRLHPQSTGRELSKYGGWDVWKRIGELKEAGMIRECGIRKCSVTGSNARTWECK